MEQNELKVSFYLKKSEADANGRCPVMARLNVGKYSEAAFSAKMSVPVSLWRNGRATGKSAEAREINRQIDETRASALSIYRELSEICEGITAEEVKCRLLGMASEQETLIGYFRKFITNFEKRVGVNRQAGSAQSYHYACNNLERFLQAKYKLTDIPFTALDRSFIDKYDLYLRTERRLASSTIIQLTMYLKVIVSEALAEGIITTFPFTGYEPKRSQQSRKYLTPEELERLMTTPLHNGKLYLIRDLFLFSCYTGIPYSDMCRLSESDLEVAEDGTLWVKAARKKTGIDYEVPLLDLPLHIIDKYRGTAPDGKLLPMYSNSELNSGLKRIAKICGIGWRLVFHCGRHTYATEITLSQGVPLETVSRMLGHSEITSTQIYAKVTDDKIGEDMAALNGRIAERFSILI